MDQKISVVIPVLNDEKKIETCLEAVFNQTITPIEVIVVDGHSSDRTVANAMRLPIKLIFENFGTVGGARQVGIENAIGYYIAFTDSDCVPDKNWLEHLVKEFQGDIVGVGGGIRNIGTGLWEESISLALDSFLGSANSVQDRVLKKKIFVNSISGCNSMYRKKDLLAIGGFNVGYSLNEDTDINKRLLETGHILYTPEAIVLHNQSRTIKQFCKRMFLFGYGRGFHRLFDIQIIPPISLIFIFGILFLSPFLFSIFLLIYLIILYAFSLAILYRIKKLKFLITLPVIFVLEHISYSMGFWYGSIKLISRSQK
jgi:glycosyltransferase involved in cell wall biosynthesis